MHTFARPEAAMEHSSTSGAFLWSDRNPERTQQVQKGQVVAQFWAGQAPSNVPNGLIHDWIGAALVTGTTVQNTLELIQDYDNHKNIYKPEVIASKLISHHENDFKIYLRLLKRKIITVVLDTDHDVHYRSIDQSRWVCHSYTTRVAEVQDAGSAKEMILPPDTVTDSSGGCIPTGDSRSVRGACTLSVGPFR